MQHQGVDYLAVAFADEGVLLRERGITMPVVVLNADADSFDAMAANRLEPEIYSRSSLQSFAETVRRNGETDYPIHIKLDTGMGRLGFQCDDAHFDASQRLKIKSQIFCTKLSALYDNVYLYRTQNDFWQ